MAVILPLRAFLTLLCCPLLNYFFHLTAYVNPDGSLTVEGKRAKDCISGGGIISGGSFLLTQGLAPASIIVDGLSVAAPIANCGGIVDFVKLKDAANVIDLLRYFGIG